MGNVKQRRVIWGLKDTSTTLPVLPTWKLGLGLGKTNTERKQSAPHFSAYGCEGGVLVSRLVSVDISPTAPPPSLSEWAACIQRGLPGVHDGGVDTSLEGEASRCREVLMLHTAIRDRAW